MIVDSVRCVLMALEGAYKFEFLFGGVLADLSIGAGYENCVALTDHPQDLVFEPFGFIEPFGFLDVPKMQRLVAAALTDPVAGEEGNREDSVTVIDVGGLKLAVAAVEHAGGLVPAG